MSMNQSSSAIEVTDLTVAYQEKPVLWDIDMNVPPGVLMAIVGPNGAGKTTLFNVIAGNLEPSSGRVFFDNEDVTGLASHELFHKGLLRTFQIPHEFGKLTVLENLMMVPAGQAGESLLATWVRPREVRKEEAEVLDKARGVLDFLNLDHLANTLAGNLSGGQKKLLELGRTMMVDAKLVLLDEVGAGVNRKLLKEVGDAIDRVHQDHGYTFCMIEHDLEFISRLCDPVIVMAEGGVLTQGSVDEVKENEAVIEAYLGAGMKRQTVGA